MGLLYKLKYLVLFFAFLLSLLLAATESRAEIADFDENCNVDIHDFVAFQNAFALKNPKADLDGDGQLAIMDFLSFQSAFEIHGAGPVEGCGSSGGGDPIGEASLFVSPDGSGSSCTIDAPCSVDDALTQASSGDIIELASGEYGSLIIEEVRFSEMVTLRAAEKHGAVFDVIQILGSSHIRLDGVANKATPWPDNPDILLGSTTSISHSPGSSRGEVDSDHIELANCLLAGPGRHTNEAALSIYWSEHVLIEGCDVSQGMRNLMSNAQNLTVKNNVFHQSSGSTVRIEGNTGDPIDNLSISGNIIHDANHETVELLYCAGMGPEPYWSGTCLADGTYKQDSSSSNPHENLLILRGVQNTIVADNLMYDGRGGLGLTIRDGGTSASAVSGENIKLYNNVVLAKFSAYTGAVDVRNNILGSTEIGRQKGTFGGISRIDAFENNIVSWDVRFNFCRYQEPSDYQCKAPTTVAPGAPVNRNIIRGITNKDLAKDTADVFEAGIGNSVYYNRGYIDRDGPEPFDLMVDPDNMDFTLVPGEETPCIADSINCGVSPVDYVPLDRAPDRDKNGNERVDVYGVGSSSDIADVGPYEYQTGID